MMDDRTKRTAPQPGAVSPRAELKHFVEALKHGAVEAVAGHDEARGYALHAVSVPFFGAELVAYCRPPAPLGPRSPFVGLLLKEGAS